jgi:hypothetical protein
MKTTLRVVSLLGLNLALIWCAAGGAEAAGKIAVSATINEGASACTFTVLVAATSPGPIGGKAPGAVYTTGSCGPAVDVPAGLYDVKIVNTTLWDQPEKWSRGVRVTDGATKSVAFAFEAGLMHLTFTCTPCVARIYKVGTTATMNSACEARSRQLSTGTYDAHFQLGSDLEVWKRGIAITKGRTQGVKPF